MNSVFVDIIFGSAVFSFVVCSVIFGMFFFDKELK